MITTMEKRVRAGAEFLDEKIPDWAQRINRATLDMCATGRCVAAQASGKSYYDITDEWGLVLQEEAIDLGFSDHFLYANCGVLTSLWHKEIEARCPKITHSTLP